MLSNHISEQWKGGENVKLPDLKKMFAKKEEPEAEEKDDMPEIMTY